MGRGLGFQGVTCWTGAQFVPSVMVLVRVACNAQVRVQGPADAFVRACAACWQAFEAQTQARGPVQAMQTEFGQSLLGG